MYKPEWQYFLALEEDLEKCSRYVEFSQENYQAYSIEFARILLASAAEFDQIAKQICKLISQDSQARNIDDYRKCIINHNPDFANIEITVPRYTLSFKPWDSWQAGVDSPNPSWWRAYTDVKHHRNTHFSSATLENTLLSVGGLLCSLLYFFQEQNSGTPPSFSCGPQLFQISNTSAFESASLRWSHGHL